MSAQTRNGDRPALHDRVLLSIPDAAAIAGLAEQTVRNALSAGGGIIGGHELRTVKIGRRRVIHTDDLLDWIDACAASTPRPGRPRGVSAPAPSAGVVEALLRERWTCCSWAERIVPAAAAVLLWADVVDFVGWLESFRDADPEVLDLIRSAAEQACARRELVERKARGVQHDDPL